MPNRQIGTSSSIEEILLSDISKQLDRLIQVAAAGGGGSGTVTSVTGVADRITITGTPTIAPIVDIAATYVGQTSITTLGTVSTGTWNATVIGPAKGGTGVANNASSTITISGAFGTTFTVTNTTSVTLPISGTLVSTALTSTYTAGAKQLFTPSATTAGLNIGLLAGDPSALSNGDLWYNSSNPSVNIRIGGVTHSFLRTGGGTAARVPFYSTSNTGLVTDSANFTFVTNRILGTTLYLTLSAGTATAGTCPLLMTSGTNLTVAISGGIEYNNTFHMTNSDATRRHVVLAANNTKVTAGAPYTNDGYVGINIGGTDFRIMTTAG